METLTAPKPFLWTSMLALALCGCSMGSDRPSSGEPDLRPGDPLPDPDPLDPTTGGGASDGTPHGDDGVDDTTTGGDGPTPGGCDNPTGSTPLGGACTDGCDCATGHCFALPIGGVCSECDESAQCMAGGEAGACTVDPTTDPPFARCTEATNEASLFSTRCEDLEGVPFEDMVKTVHGVTIAAADGSANTTGRREHARISQGLADALGIDDNDVADSGPAWQVRVTLEDVDPGSSANFTVAEIDSGDSGLRLDVWLPSGGGNHNGFYKLFGDASTSVLDDEPKATVHVATPYATMVVGDAMTTAHVHLPEPTASDKTFHECVELHGNTLAVVAPHGGDIENHITDEFPRLLSTLEELGQSPSVWEAIGLWNGGSAYRRWHITATQIFTESFPGYTMLADAGPYKYTLSIHGFGNSDKAVVVGGRASRRVKCFLVDRLEKARTVSTNLKYKIHGPDGDPIDVNGSLNESGLTGMSSNNIVNRLSSSEPGAGGIQLELSTEMRNDSELFADFMHALGVATHELIELELTDEPDTDYCAMLE